MAETQVDPHVCQECKFRKDSPEHMRGVGLHGAPSTEPEAVEAGIPCSACGERFPTPLKLGQHTKKEHGKSLAELRGG